MKALVILFTSLFYVLFINLANANTDNEHLNQIFEEDQQARELGEREQTFPRVEDDLKRRAKVFEIIANGSLNTANDHIKALVVLQHTTLRRTESGGLQSFSPENHILAFELAGKAFEMGHDKGAHFLAWTYNYYAQGVGCDPEIFGFDYSNGKISARTANITKAERFEQCGWFNPTDTYQELGLL